MTQVNDKSTVNDIKKFLDENGIEYSGSLSKSELLNLIPLEEDNSESDPMEDVTTNTPTKNPKPDTSDPIVDIPDVPYVPTEPASDSWSDIIMGGNSKGGPTNDIPDENYYTVVEGDTLVAIANKFAKSVAKIKKLNNMTSNVVRVGRKLRLV